MSTVQCGGDCVGDVVHFSRHHRWKRAMCTLPLHQCYPPQAAMSSWWWSSCIHSPWTASRRRKAEGGLESSNLHIQDVRHIDEKLVKYVTLNSHAIIIHATSLLRLLLDAHVPREDSRCLTFLHLAHTARSLLLPGSNDASATAPDFTARAMHLYFSTSTLEATMGHLGAPNLAVLLSFKHSPRSSQDPFILVAGHSEGHVTPPYEAIMQCHRRRSLRPFHCR